MGHFRVVYFLTWPLLGNKTEVDVLYIYKPSARGPGSPLYKLGMCRHQGVWFLSRFRLKMGIDFDHYGFKSGMVFKRTTRAYKRICLFNSNWIVEKEKYPKYIIRAQFYQFLTLLPMRSSIIVQQRSENGYGKWHVLVWNWVRIWGTVRHAPTENSEECPPPLPPLPGLSDHIEVRMRPLAAVKIKG